MEQLDLSLIYREYQRESQAREEDDGVVVSKKKSKYVLEDNLPVSSNKRVTLQGTSRRREVLDEVPVTAIRSHQTPTCSRKEV